MCCFVVIRKNDTRAQADGPLGRRYRYWRCAQKQAIVTLVERKSGFAVLAKVLNKPADLVGRAIEEKLKPFGSRVKTLTVDNGQEFADHQTIDQTLEIQTYFADQSV
jgi:IS30 family transposase